MLTEKQKEKLAAAKQQALKTASKTSVLSAVDSAQKYGVMTNSNTGQRASKPATTQAAQKSVSQQKPSATGSDRSKNGQSATKGHYIQVGSFGNTPNKEFLGKINNYSYRTYKTKNSTKYLIGPYNSRTDANRDMLKVKTDMGDEVFYYEVK